MAQKVNEKVNEVTGKEFDKAVGDKAFKIRKKIKFGLYLGGIFTAASSFLALTSSNINRTSIFYHVEHINRKFKNQHDAWKYVTDDVSYEEKMLRNISKYSIDGVDSSWIGFNYGDESNYFANDLSLQQHFLNRLQLKSNSGTRYVALDEVPAGFLDGASVFPYYKNVDNKNTTSNGLKNYYLGMTTDASGNVIPTPFETEEDAIDSITTKTGAYTFNGKNSSILGVVQPDNTISGIVGIIVTDRGYEVVERDMFEWDQTKQVTLTNGFDETLLPALDLYATINDAVKAARDRFVVLERNLIQEYTAYTKEEWNTNVYNDKDEINGYQTKFDAWQTANTIPESISPVAPYPADFRQSEAPKGLVGAIADVALADVKHSYDGTQLTSNRGAIYNWGLLLNGGQYKNSMLGGTDAYDAQTNGYFANTARTLMRTMLVMEQTHGSSGCGVPTGSKAQIINYQQQWHWLVGDFSLRRYLIDANTDEAIWNWNRECEAGTANSTSHMNAYAEILSYLDGSKFSDGSTLYERMFFDGIKVPEKIPTEADYDKATTSDTDFNDWRQQQVTDFDRVIWNKNVYESETDELLLRQIDVKSINDVTADQFVTVARKFVHGFNVPTHGIDPARPFVTEQDALTALRNAIINWKPYGDTLKYTSIDNNPYSAIFDDLFYNDALALIKNLPKYRSSKKLGDERILVLNPDTTWAELTNFSPIALNVIENFNGTGDDYYMKDIDANLIRMIFGSSLDGIKITPHEVPDPASRKFFLIGDLSVNEDLNHEPIYFDSIGDAKEYWKDYLQNLQGWTIGNPDEQTNQVNRTLYFRKNLFLNKED